MLKRKRLFSCFTMLLALVVSNCFAQQKLRLRDLNKIEFYQHGGGLSSDEKKIEVIFEDGNWNAYQTKMVQWRNESNNEKIFIKTVSAKLLNKLLYIVNDSDTSKNIKLFNIKTDDLINTIDSSLNWERKYWDVKNNGTYVETILKKEQKAAVLKAINNKEILKKSFEKALTPMLMADKTYYSISFISNSKEQLKVEAYSFADVYNLPWYVNKRKKYNPNISLIFEFILGNKIFPSQQRGWLLDKINVDIYNTYFKTPFNWSDFKIQQPETFSLLGNTLTPANFSKYKDRSIVYFNSSLLPKYVQIPAFFQVNDTVFIKQVKKFENTLVDVFKNDNFLFKYLEARSDATVIINPTTIGNFGVGYFRDIKNYYKDIVSFDQKNVQILEVYIGKEMRKELRSKWMWLPNNTLLLLKYDFDKLKNLPLTNLVSDKKPYEEVVCILFDANGKVIKNYGKAKIDID